ncbi:hypothetical protein [Salinibacter altiplanensis]|uniref:hypothetical protein n=1 Tax=Salinibacter altiplanensis TaxID=1803181 RepID=UPI001319FD75|nr:hypothetical protein [Salinibacter altiplanensis]
MSSIQPINVHRFEGGHHHVTTGDPEDLSGQDDADRMYAKLELRFGGKSASFNIYQNGEILGYFSPPAGIPGSDGDERFTHHEVHRVKTWDSTDIQSLIGVFRNHEYRHDPVDIANDSIFKSLFDHVAQRPYETRDFKFDDKIERATRSLSILKPKRHFLITRTRVTNGLVKAFRCWMYYQNDCILEEVADLESTDD